MIEPSSKIARPDYLTEVLRCAGVLPDGGVREVVTASSTPTILSRIDRLRLSYDGNAGGAPATLILKTGLPGGSGEAWSAGRQEVAFYRRIAPATPGLVPYCFDAAWDADTRDWHLLLEDLTDTHVSPSTWPLPPTPEQCRAILEARARFHAAWWNDPRLGISIGSRFDLAAAAKYAEEMIGYFTRFADRLGDRLSRERRALYERFLPAMPSLLAQVRPREGGTIIHGDAHVWNTFLPRDAGGRIVLFDWDAWRIGLGATDLAYMMAMHWYPDYRRCFERSLLDHYHGELLAHGAHGYDRRALADDYRLAAFVLIATPVRQAAHGIPTVIWWNNFERIMMAVDDLGCRELLK